MDWKIALSGAVSLIHAVPSGCSRFTDGPAWGHTFPMNTVQCRDPSQPWYIHFPLSSPPRGKHIVPKARAMYFTLTPHRCCSFEAGVNRAKANSGLLTEAWSHPELGDIPHLTLSTPNLNLFFRVTTCKKNVKENPRSDRPERETHMNS